MLSGASGAGEGDSLEEASLCGIDGVVFSFTCRGSLGPFGALRLACTVSTFRGWSWVLQSSHWRSEKLKISDQPVEIQSVGSSSSLSTACTLLVQIFV